MTDRYDLGWALDAATGGVSDAMGATLEQMEELDDELGSAGIE